jgi:HK97 family phage major capsid protein
MVMSPIGERNASISLDSAGNDFIKYAKLVAAARGRIGDLQRLASQVPSRRVADIVELLEQNPIQKSAVGVLGLSEALAPYQALAEGFFASMAGFSSFATIFNAGDFYRVPLRTLIGVLTSAPVGDSVSELAAKPLHAGNFAQSRFEPSKVTSLIVITNELARSVSQAAILQFGNELRRASSIASDAHFLAVLATTPGITTGASTGVTASAILADLTAALQRLAIGADSRLWFICSPKLAKTISLLQGTGGYLAVNNRIGGITVAVSDAATTAAYLIDAKQIAAELETVTVDSSESASLQLADNPTSGFQLVSLFTQNLTALRAELWFGCLALRSTAVTTITGFS